MGERNFLLFYSRIGTYHLSMYVVVLIANGFVIALCLAGSNSVVVEVKERVVELRVAVAAVDIDAIWWWWTD